VAESEHDWQVPLQFELQHTPWAQKPERHSMPSLHVLPSPLRPHEPPVQTAGAAQSASDEHAALQTAPPHWNGKHELAGGVTHAPAPSHEETGVNAVLCAGHVESLHAVPSWYFWQAPAWHFPFVPQAAGPASVHSPAGSGAPFGAAVHVPSAPGSAHELHAPPHAVSQQTPWAQKPVWHSPACEHEAPRIFLPHEFPLQTLGATQFWSEVQASKHALPLQVYGAHGSESGGVHWPVALHVEGGV
jgi:hypothetical protein